MIDHGQTPHWHYLEPTWHITIGFFADRILIFDSISALSPDPPIPAVPGVQRQS